MPCGINGDHLTGLTWDRLDHVLSIYPELGIAVWKNPSGNKAKVLAGTMAGTMHKKYKYISVCIDYNDYKLHRLIWFYVHRYWPKNDIDHINGNRIDNRISNLREATRAQNSWNANITKKNKTGRKGVSWDKYRNKWRVTLKVNGKFIQPGRFDKFEDAVKARENAERIHHKEYARVL